VRHAQRIRFFQRKTSPFASQLQEAIAIRLTAQMLIDYFKSTEQGGHRTYHSLTQSVFASLRGKTCASLETFVEAQQR
jgi:hypothetical protein